MIARQFEDGERRTQLFEEVAAIFRSRSQSEWVELMRDTDCCCEPVLSMAEAFEHPQARAREMVREFQSSCDGRLKQLGFSSKLSDTPAQTETESPTLGQHTNELLAEIGLPKETIHE